MVTISPAADSERPIIDRAEQSDPAGRTTIVSVADASGRASCSGVVKDVSAVQLVKVGAGLTWHHSDGFNWRHAGTGEGAMS